MTSNDLNKQVVIFWHTKNPEMLLCLPHLDYKMTAVLSFHLQVQGRKRWGWVAVQTPQSCFIRKAKAPPITPSRVLPKSHWPELGHTTTPNNKGEVVGGSIGDMASGWPTPYKTWYLAGLGRGKVLNTCFMHLCVCVCLPAYLCLGVVMCALHFP